MLDFGWAELAVVAMVAILVIGPKEMPEVMRAMGKIVRKLQDIKFGLSKQFEDFMQESDVEELRKSVNFKVMEGDPSTFDEAAEDEEYITAPSGKNAPSD